MLLSDAEVEEIREGVKSGLRGPVLLKWVEQLLADRDERVRLELERATAERVRGRYGRRQGADPEWH
jgi:hypothetical protein